MRTALWMCSLGLVVLTGCGTVVRGGPLSHRGVDEQGEGIYLSTGGSPRPFRTLGFAQIMGEGRTFAGVADVGEAGFDRALRGALATEARRMGGDAVIHIEFVDENPPTDYERVQDAANTFNSLATGKADFQQRRRSVVVTGEIIQFTDR